MCGIVGYIGHRETAPLLVEALERLEYRGYDSCGIAVLDDGSPRIIRAVGAIAALDARLRSLGIVTGAGVPAGNGDGAAVPGNGAVQGLAARVSDGAPVGAVALADPGLAPGGGRGSGGDLPPQRCGIGHTRWATHGRPTEHNAHPHADCSGNIIVVHNGIIENHLELRARLSGEGHRFVTETDTEVLPHLIESHLDGNLEDAVRAALAEVEGVYGLLAVSPYDGGKIVVARHGPPLVVGLGRDETFVASDAPALLPWTRSMVFLEDREMAVVRPGSVHVTDFGGRPVDRTSRYVGWTAEMAEKEGWAHFMLKEIHEEPRALADTLRGRIRQGAVRLEADLGEVAGRVAAARRVQVVACGTSLHAGQVAGFMIEQLAGVPVDVDYASEFRYRGRPLDEDTLVLGVSQSGETADTLAALEEAGRGGATLLTVCNVVGSSMTRLCDGVLHTHAGPEIGVASTKAFTTQLAVLQLLALYMAQERGRLDAAAVAGRAAALLAIPGKVEEVLRLDGRIRDLAARFQDRDSFLYLGRGPVYPIALEGALKLKEISYIHAEGYPAGEMKHGPIALVDDDLPVVFLVPRGPLYRKSMANLEEVKVRGGIVLAVATDGDTDVVEIADETLFLPDTDDLLTPITAATVLQLLAYHVADLRGLDVDRPRNLAKCVTVE